MLFVFLFLTYFTLYDRLYIFHGKTVPINIFSLNVNNRRDLKFGAVQHRTPQSRNSDISITGHHL